MSTANEFSMEILRRFGVPDDVIERTESATLRFEVGRMPRLDLATIPAEAPEVDGLSFDLVPTTEGRLSA